MYIYIYMYTYISGLSFRYLIIVYIRFTNTFVLITATECPSRFLPNACR